MPCAPIVRFGGRAEVCKAEAGEIMSGVLEIIRGSSLTNSLSQSPKLSRAKCSVGRDIGLAPQSQRVLVRVYRTSSEHFAVLYPIRAIVTACRPLASINLRSCSVKTVGREFKVSPRACEGLSVTLRALEGSSDSQMSDWLQAFSDTAEGLPRRKVSDQRSPLPVLEEREEDESEERADAFSL